ncbi:retrovirus-related pol polyprotein from transposon TNT 1-94 [Tanacetum coccineum]
MSNTNNIMQTQTSNALHNAIIEAGGKYHPPILAPGNYIQWNTRIKRYIDTKPNHKLIHHCLEHPPYKFKWAERTIPVAEGIDNGIYSTVDACPNAMEIWKAIERLKQGESINVQDLETNLYWEFGKFTSQDGESLESYYSRTQQAATGNRGKAIVNSPSPTNDQEPAMVVEDNEITSLNTSRANQDNTLRINRGTGYDNQRAVTVVGARETVGTQVVQQSGIQCYNCKEYGHVLSAEQVDWRDDSDDEPEDQELEAHYLYMAKIQEVIPDAADNFGPVFNADLLQKVQNDDDNYNVFVNDKEHPEQPETVNDIYPDEQGDTNIIIDSLDISYNREDVDQDDDDLAKERDLLASLIEKLKCEIDDSKNRNKLLESSNQTLVNKLKSLIDDFENKNKCLESSNNHFKEANTKLAKNNQLMFKDLKKFQAELDRYHDVNYASKVEIECAKAKGELVSHKMSFEKSFNEYTRKINDLNQTISKMKKELIAHQESISIMSQEKEAQKKFYKTREDKELEKVIALENKIKVLDDIVYNTSHSVQTMNMLNRNCKTSFVKPEFLKKAQRASPRLYDIGCYNDNLALMLAPKYDETIRLAQRSRSKLSDLIKPFDYKNLNNLYDLFVPQREKSAEQRYFSERSRMSHTSGKNQCQEQIKNDKVWKQKESTSFRELNVKYFEIQDLKAQLQDKGIAISELKKLIEKMKGKSVETKFEKPSVIRQPNAFKRQRQSNLGKPATFLDSLSKKDFSKSKSVTIKNVCNDLSKPVTAQFLPQNVNTVQKNTNVIAPGIKCVLNDNHDMRVLYYINGVNSRTKQPIDVPVSIRKPKRTMNQFVATSLKKTVASESTNQKPRSTIRKQYEYVSKACKGWYSKITPPGYKWKSKTSKVNVIPNLVKIIMFIVDSECSKHMTGNLKLLSNFVEKFLGTVKFGNDQIAPILDYGDLGNDLLTGSCGTDLYSITLPNTTSPNPICLMDKASSSQVWLCHRRLSHMNFDTINLLSKYNIVTGLPKLKFVKDHLCSSCELGKAKRKSFKIKTTSSSKRWLQILHMDLCGPMRVESFNGKKYVLVIVDDYSIYTWTHFLRSKDETPKVLIDFLKLVQIGLHAQVRTVRTNKGTKFLNKTIHAYFDQEGIKHQTSIARNPEQSGVVERRNHTLVEATRTMLSAAKVPLFFWDEAIATTCFTQTVHS